MRLSIPLVLLTFVLIGCGDTKSTLDQLSQTVGQQETKENAALRTQIEASA